jgi:hypothetical protein
MIMAMTFIQNHTKQSFFDEHTQLADKLLRSRPLPHDADVPAYLKPQVDFMRLVTKIPERELFRFDNQWTDFIAAFSTRAENERQWPKSPYCFRQGLHDGFEQWLDGLNDRARDLEKEGVRTRHHAEHTVLVKAILHFQMLWPNPSDPDYVTPANWDAEGVSIADRYAHLRPAKEHWLLDITSTYRLYSLADSRRETPPSSPGKPTPV